MSKYQPPHLRNRAPAPIHAAAGVSDSLAAAPTSGNRRPEQSPRAPVAGPSHPPFRGVNSFSRSSARGGGGSAGSALASPASDLRARRAGTPVGGRDVDEMEMLQSVSRSGGDGAEGDALKDWALQDRYRAYIDERLEKHYTSFGSTADDIPAAGSEAELESLGSIVLLLRKLREGVVASGRVDGFAVQVFETSARLAILARNTAQTISALSGLVPGLYAAVAGAEQGTAPVDQANGMKGKGRSTAPSTCGEDLLVSDIDRLEISSRTADNRAAFATLLLLFHLCHTQSPAAYHATLMDLTLPPRRRPGSDGVAARTLPAHRPYIAPTDVAIVVRAARCLAPHTFDPISFFRLAHDSAVPAPARAILRWAEAGVRERAWEVLRRAYLEVRLPWAGEWLGLPPREGVHRGLEKYMKEKGVERDDGGRVKLR